MNTGPTSKLRRLSRHRYTLTLALLIVSGLLAGCTKDNPNNNRPVNSTQGVQTQTPSPTPPPGLGDRPVIITGGSLEIDFDRVRDYTEAVGDNGFRSLDTQLSAIQLFDDQRGNSVTRPAIEIAGPATIQIFGRGPTGGARLMFTIKDDTNSVVVTFEAADFTPKVAEAGGTRRHGRARKHFDHRFHLEDVKLQDRNFSTPTSILTSDRCVNKNKCTIEIGATR